MCIKWTISLFLECFLASDTSEAETEVGSETETEAEDSTTPRSKGRLRAVFKHFQPTPPSEPVSNNIRNRSFKSNKPSKRDLSLPVPEILYPIVYHADFGLNENLSIMRGLTSVVQQGVDIPGVKGPNSASSDVYKNATAGVNGGPGVIGSPESIVAGKTGARKLDSSHSKSAAFIAAHGTATTTGAFQPVEAIGAVKTGVRLRPAETSSEDYSSETSLEEESTSKDSNSVVIAGQARVVKTIPAPPSMRSSNRSSSQATSSSLSPSTVQSANLPSSNIKNSNFSSNGFTAAVISSHQPKRQRVVSPQRAALIGQQPQRLQPNNVPTCPYCLRENMDSKSVTGKCPYCLKEEQMRRKSKNTRDVSGNCPYCEREKREARSRGLAIPQRINSSYGCPHSSKNQKLTLNQEESHQGTLPDVPEESLENSLEGGESTANTRSAVIVGQAPNHHSFYAQPSGPHSSNHSVIDPPSYQHYDSNDQPPQPASVASYTKKTKAQAFYIHNQQSQGHSSPSRAPQTSGAYFQNSQNPYTEPATSQGHYTVSAERESVVIGKYTYTLE